MAVFNLVLIGVLHSLGCGVKSNITPTPNSCAPPELQTVAGDSGEALAFLPDPMARAGDPRLSPTSAYLDKFRSSVSLSHLNGKGVLQGSYVHVLNGIKCDMNYGAYAPNQQFNYTHDDWRFQEAMAYYLGDQYQSRMDQIGYLKRRDPVRIVAHCDEGDNAFFVRNLDPSGEAMELVCLFDSLKTKGAYYGDDGIVTVHELEHAATVDNYSPVQDFNQFWFDEAGSLNEAISDFLSMQFTNSMIPPSSPLDLRVFSRWALGTFDKQSSHLRGAHRCPVYDSHYPNCDTFPQFAAPTPENGMTTSISYVYPDGVGWPYPNNFPGPDAALQTYQRHLSQEEIHNAGILMLGALWDVSTAVKANHPGEEESMNDTIQKLVLESVRHLPMADYRKNRSPISFTRFAELLIQYSNQIPGLTDLDKLAVTEALKKRGLHETPALASEDWMDVGPGLLLGMSRTPSPGVYIQDDPKRLRRWLGQIGADPSIVKQNLESGLNGRLDPGEVAALWFDIQNNDPVTAGGVLLTVTSLDEDVVLLDESINIGYLEDPVSNSTQVMYEKINGTSIVAALNPSNGKYNVPISNSYFRTNPYFSNSYRTAVWVKVRPETEHGKVVTFQVEAAPSNGPSTVRTFPVTIN